MSRSFAAFVACLIAPLFTVPAAAADFLLKANSGLAFDVPNPSNPLGYFSFKTVDSGAAESEILWGYDFTYLETGCHDGSEPGCFDSSYWYVSSQYGDGGDTATSTWQPDFIQTFADGGVSGWDGHLGFTNFGNFDVLLRFSFDATLAPGQTSVPEPASWAMMLSGFGLVGGAMRRKKAIASLA